MSTQLTTDPAFKSFVYDARGYKDINAKIDADLAAWQTAATRYTLAYDTGSAIFVVGEVVSGATGVGTVLALAAGSDATSGTLIISLTTPGFVAEEAITGDIAGAAEVVIAETETVVPITIGSIQTAVSQKYTVVAVTYSASAQV